MQKQYETQPQNAGAEKAALTSVLALFILYIEHRHTTAQLRALAKAWLIVSREARSPWHMAQLIQLLNEEMEEDEIPLSKQGTYLLRRVQSKALPKVPKSYNPFTWEV